MNLQLDLTTGHCNGPLFAPPVLLKPPVRPKGKEGAVHREQTKRATPSWADLKEIAKVYRYARRLSPLAW